MRNLTGPVFILISALSWSTAGLFTRVVTTDIPTTLLWRSIIGGVCLFVIYLLFYKKVSLKEAVSFSFGEFCIAASSAAAMVCFISAFFYTSIANVTFIFGIVPLATYALSLIILKERARLISTMCCALSLCGVGVMAFDTTTFSDLFGIALSFGMVVFVAFFTISIKLFPEANSTKSTYLSAFFIVLATLPFATYSVLPVSDYLWLGLYGLVTAVLGFELYIRGVSYVSALAAALISLVEVPLAPLWAWMLFSETISGPVLAGGGLIIISAILYIVKTHGNEDHNEDHNERLHEHE